MLNVVVKDLKYLDSHEWVKVEGNSATVGITDQAQDHLGKVVKVNEELDDSPGLVIKALHTKWDQANCQANLRPRCDARRKDSAQSKDPTQAWMKCARKRNSNQAILTQSTWWALGSKSVIVLLLWTS
nr:uncharacterized protein LOC112023799 [Quercus suber]